VRLLAVCLLAFLGACEEPSEPAPPPEEDPPADELEARSRRRGDEIASFMEPYGDPIRGTLEEGGVRDVSQRLTPGFCYKIVAVATEGIEDLDLRVFDANQVLLERDATEDAQPFLGHQSPVCPADPAIYRVEVRALRGAGEFMIRFYRTL
jgi:hypothetical protein